MGNAVSIFRSVIAPTGIAVGYGVTAALSLWLTRGPDGIVAMWPASGILLAGLAQLSGYRLLICLLLAAAASVAVNLQAGVPLPVSLGFTVANMVEAAVGAALLRRWRVARPRFGRARDVSRFCGAVLIAALAGTGAMTVAVGGGALAALNWFATVLLGMFIVAPLVLMSIRIADPGPRSIHDDTARLTVMTHLLMVAAVTLIVFVQQRFQIMFLPLVALLAATWRLGPLGAVAGVGIVAVIAPVMTVMGHGPLWMTRQSAVEQSFFLQFYLLTLFATALPFGALLAQQRRLAADRADSERMHRLLADSSTDVILRLSLDGVARYCSPAVTAVLGFTPEQTVGQTPILMVHPDDRALVDAAWQRAITSPAPETVTFRHLRADGSHAWLEVAYRRVATDMGEEVVARARDISNRRAAELAVQASERQMREANRLLGMAERAAQLGHWRIDLTTATLFWSPEVHRMHGLAVDATPDLAGAIDFYHPDDRARVAAIVAKAIEKGEPFDFEARIVRTDGEQRHVLSRGQPEIAYDGTTTAMFGIVQNISQRIEAEQALEAARAAAEAAAAHAMQLADTDALTGLASRRRSLAQLDEAVAAAARGGEPLALAIFDIDHFKSVNDRFGHPAGDAVLRRVARAASHAVRPTDLVGRLGGEEFVVVLPGANAATALTVAEALRRAIAASADGVEAGPPVTASIGIATLVPGGSAASLLGEADRALYEAKNAGRNAARLAA
ncbi:sensor domain-containing diguanylate cyclase [Sphingomonas rubra]|uniref:diguanylate cyclase n=1 Tax=Sphingomonas rubra TaxID=634430 RepID=A0A1I5UE05_9SPHN|nr:sensor domain-containing diguanylate cyclase [Sphingomonas rubra]SFP93247.1 PAS domain S-box-containing protein/diguanylate cyclase (GGDEF) domain-containing protein [Sphingomonas rubra]